MNSPLKNSDDLVRIIHMVYVWMPKMLRSFNDNVNEIDLDNLYRLAKKARNETITAVEEKSLFIQLAKLTNNYMVGASKVLSIINPQVYPIFDRRVVSSWNRFILQVDDFAFMKLRNHCVDRPAAMVNNYRYYMDTLIIWSGNTNLSVRDIEFLFWIARDQ